MCNKTLSWMKFKSILRALAVGFSFIFFFFFFFVKSVVAF